MVFSRARISSLNEEMEVRFTEIVLNIMNLLVFLLYGMVDWV